jgi:putative hydrolase of the HAD superfamily
MVHGLEIDQDDAFRFWQDLEREYYDQYLAGRISFEEQRLFRMRDFYDRIGPKETTDHALRKRFEAYLKSYEANWQTYPDADVMLRLLRNSRVPCCMITNGARSQQERKAKRLGLSWMPMLTSEDAGIAKPGKQIFIEACRRLELEPSAVIHFGDDRRADWEGALQAGLGAVLLERDHSNAVWGDFSELSRALRFDFQIDGRLLVNDVDRCNETWE